MTITKESFLNFELNCLVSHNGRKAIVSKMFRPKIRVRFLDNGLHEWVEYSDLTFLEYEARVVLLENESKQWSKKDLDFVKENINVKSPILAEALKRSIGSINSKKYLLRAKIKK